MGQDGVVLAKPPETWTRAIPLVPAPGFGLTTPDASLAPLPEQAQPCSCLLDRGPGTTGIQVLGDGGPFSAAGGARGYGMWGFQIRECPHPPHCKVASCGKQGPGGGGYVSFRLFVVAFFFLFFSVLACGAAERIGTASGFERRRRLCVPHSPSPRDPAGSRGSTPHSRASTQTPTASSALLRLTTSPAANRPIRRRCERV